MSAQTFRLPQRAGLPVIRAVGAAAVTNAAATYFRRPIALLPPLLEAQSTPEDRPEMQTATGVGD
jgi:hypothetical protein